MPQPEAVVTAVEHAREAPVGRLTPRALALGLLGVAILCIAIPYTTGFMFASELGGCHFPVGPVFLLLVLVLPLAWVSTHISRRLALRPQENLIVTAMMLVAAGIPTFGLALYLFPVMTAPFYMATPENRWEETFFQYLPEWIAPAPDSTAVRIGSSETSAPSPSDTIWSNNLAFSDG